MIGWVAPSGTGYCSAERDVGDTRIAFVRFPQGYALILRSPGWNLRAEGDYPVKFAVAFVTSGRAAGRVLAPNIILVQLTSDPAAMRQIAGGQTFEVEAADTKVSVPLEQFADALSALDTCLAQTPQPGQTQEPPQRAPDPQQPNTPGNFPGAPQAAGLQVRSRDAGDQAADGGVRRRSRRDPTTPVIANRRRSNPSRHAPKWIASARCASQ